MQENETPPPVTPPQPPLVLDAPKAAPKPSFAQADYTLPAVLVTIILTILLVAGLWLFVYGANLEQKTVITPVGTAQPTPSTTPNAID